MSEEIRVILEDWRHIRSNYSHESEEDDEIQPEFDGPEDGTHGSSDDISDDENISLEDDEGTQFDMEMENPKNTHAHGHCKKDKLSTIV